MIKHTRTLWLLASLSVITFFGPHNCVRAQEPSQATITLPQKAHSGSVVSGTIEIPAGAPQGGLLVTLGSDDPGAAKVEPQSKQLKAEEKSFNFTVQAANLAGPKDIQIWADVGGQRLNFKLRIHPLLMVTPPELAGGDVASGKIELASKAPPTGVIFTLSSNSPLATFEPPQQVTIKPDKQEATFKILTKSVPATTPVEITAEGGGVSQTVKLTLKYDWGRLAAAIISGLIVTALAFFILPYLWKLFRRLTGNNPAGTGARTTRSINDGEDGLPSTSIFQNYLWTAVIIYAYSSLAFIKLWWLGGTNNLTITRNIVIVMGASITTRVLARAITAKQVREGRIIKMSPVMAKTHLEGKGWKRWSLLKYIFTDDDGNPDLNKIQIMAWTLIAVGIFLIDWHSNIMFKNAVDMNLPTIDDALIVLMGLSAGGYLSNKLIKVERPILLNADPPNPKKGTPFRLNGQFFSLNPGSIVVDGKTASDWAVKEWQDTFVKVEVPATAKKGTYSVGVIANNQPSATTVNIEVTE